MNFIAAAAVAAAFHPGLPPPDAQRLREIGRALEHGELESILKPDRVETFAVEDLLDGRDKKAPPASIPVTTDLPGRFVILPGSLPVPPELSAEFSRLLLSPASYSPRVTACIFAPGVAVRFHRGTEAIDVFVCFHCRELAFQRVGKRQSHRKLSFDPVQQELFRLVQRARPDDARLEAVRREWEAEAARAREQAAAEERWRQAMPASLRPFWEEMSTSPWPDREVAAMQAALAREIPGRHDRIRALLRWYGAGDGPWSGYPAYEGAAEALLLEYPTSELIAATTERALDPQETEGAARLFAGWDFRRARPDEGQLLSPELRRRLLEHSLASGDEDKRDRARAAFAAR